MVFLGFVVILLWALMTFVAHACAHDVGCNGRLVPLKVKEGCCGLADAAFLDSSEVKREDNVWYALLDGSWHALIRFNEPIELQPSDDGCWWVWYRRKNAENFYEDHNGVGSDYAFYCFQGPLTF
jgi:hypothetical protein